MVMAKCRLCGAETGSSWSVKDAKSAETLEMFMCGSCALVQQANLPTDEELRIQLGGAGKKRASELFSLERMLRDHTEIYHLAHR